VLNATRYSLAGIAAAARHEAAFRELAALCVVAIPAAIWLGQTGVERALLIAVVVLALIVELLNAAVEAVVDRVSLEHHRLAKRAKDIGSAAVMVSLLNAAAVWLLVLL
jgi:diacylglycerol kinase (ATP)